MDEEILFKRTSLDLADFMVLEEDIHLSSLQECGSLCLANRDENCNGFRWLDQQCSLGIVSEGPRPGSHQVYVPMDILQVKVDFPSLFKAITFTWRRFFTLIMSVSTYVIFSFYGVNQQQGNTEYTWTKHKGVVKKIIFLKFTLELLNFGHQQMFDVT